MPKLFWRIFLILWLSIVGFSSLVVVISDQVARNNGIQDINEVLKIRMTPLLRELKQGLEKEGPQSARSILRQAPPRIRNLVFVIDAEQKELLGRKKFKKRLHKNKGGQPNRSLTAIDPAGKQWTIQVSALVPPRALLASSSRGTLSRLLLAALLSAVISWLLARSLARPLLQLGLASVALAQGKLQSRVKGKILRRRDEVGDLARSFNQMATDIETLDRSRQNLLRDVAHELRSPLARMQVAVELARDKGDHEQDDNEKPPGASGQRELSIIAREIQRLEKMIAEVLVLLRDAGSVKDMEKETYSLAALLESLVSRVNYEADAKELGRVRLIQESDIELFINPELIYRALENLLRNACRFTDVSKGVEITVEAVTAGAEFCCIKIRDYGPGVPEAFISQMFEPFTRLSSARERTTGDDGWGLGTAIAAAAISRHGGEIEANNMPEGGLEITIRLPFEG
ncbi:MAG: ATP-binding protein [Xanthomonadales bacterium]|nr:ATP-binding protein [Xanthomonadales bacterium]